MVTETLDVCDLRHPHSLPFWARRADRGHPRTSGSASQRQKVNNMSVNIGIADEATFKQFAKRVHKSLRKLTPDQDFPLGHIQEAVIQALGHRSLHDARQAWKASGQRGPVPVDFVPEPVPPAASPIAVPARPQWTHLPETVQAELDGALRWDKRFELDADQEGGYGDDLMPIRSPRTSAPVSGPLTRPGAVPPLWKEAMTALKEGADAFLAWVAEHPDKTDIRGLDSEGRVTSLIFMVLDAPDGMATYRRLMDEAILQNWPVAPRLAHLQHVLDHHGKNWLRHPEWLWFADHLHEALLEFACKAVWHHSYHPDYRDPPQAWEKHLPWQFVARALKRNAAAVHLHGWLPGAWCLVREDWAGVAVWISQLDADPKRWGSYERNTARRALFEAARLGKNEPLAQLFQLPPFHFERGLDHFHSSVSLMQQASRWALAQGHPETARLCVAYFVRHSTSGEVEGLLDELTSRMGSVALLDFWLTELRHRHGWTGDAERHQDRLALALKNTQSEATEVRQFFKQRTIEQGQESDWSHAVVQVFADHMRQAKQGETALRPHSKAGKAWIHQAKTLLAEGARWDHGLKDQARTPFAALMLRTEFDTSWAKVAIGLGADINERHFGSRTVLEQGVQWQSIEQVRPWAQMGAQLSPFLKARAWLLEELTDRRWATGDGKRTTDATQKQTNEDRLRAGIKRHRLPATDCQGAWDLLRHPDQVRIWSELSESLPDEASMDTWFRHPVLVPLPSLTDSSGVNEPSTPPASAPAPQEAFDEYDRDDDDETREDDLPQLQKVLAMIQEAVALGASTGTENGDGPTLLHRLSLHRDTEGTTLVALLDLLVEHGADPEARDGKGHLARDWPEMICDQHHSRHITRGHEHFVRRIRQHEQAREIARSYA